MKILAMVKFNNEWAHVFNEPIHYKYTEEKINGKRFLVGRCGPFRDFLEFQMAQGRFRAFGGRPFKILMESGELRELKDNWWASLGPDRKTTSLIYQTIQRLEKSYAFEGGQICPKVLKEMVEEYEREGGYRYRSEEYESVINFEKTRIRGIKEMARALELQRQAKLWKKRALELQQEHRGGRFQTHT